MYNHLSTMLNHSVSTVTQNGQTAKKERVREFQSVTAKSWSGSLTSNKWNICKWIKKIKRAVSSEAEILDPWQDKHFRGRNKMFQEASERS